MSMPTQSTTPSPTSSATPSGFTATVLESGGYHHELVVTPLASQPPMVNLRVMTRYDHSRDPEHRREILNLSLQRHEIDALVQHLRHAMDFI